MPERPRVALLIETSRAAGRGLLRGVIRYLNEHNPWSLYFRPAGLSSLPPRWLTNWHGDPGLAGLREPGALDRLPAEERKEWFALWADVDALLNRTTGP